MKRQNEDSDRPLPTRVPRTELFNYPTQLYFLILKMPMSRTSVLVEKMGNSTVKIQRTGQSIKLSQEEYDSLEPVNPSIFGRFARQGGAERRDEALELGLRLVLNQNQASSPNLQSFLTAEDVAALAQTNRTALEQALISNANNFRASPSAKAQFLSAIRKGDLETVALFEKYQAPLYGHEERLAMDGPLFQALISAVEGGHNELFKRLRRLSDEGGIIADDEDAWRWNWQLGFTRAGNQAIFEAIIRTRNMDLLRFMIDEMPDVDDMGDIFQEGVEWILFKISELNWAEAVPLLLKVFPESDWYQYNGNLVHLTPLAFWIKRKNLRMIALILQRRPPEEQRFMLKCFSEGVGNAITEALKLGKDGLDIVQFCLSKSVKGDSVCGNDPDAILTAIHYQDPLGNSIEAPIQVVAEIVRDYLTNMENARDVVQLRLGVLSPLLACCKFREDNPIECARLLLDAGADINEFHKESYFTTPLLAACRRNNLPLARFLLDRGANPNLANPTRILGGYRLLLGEESVRVRETPLLVATVLRNRELVELLLARGANPSEGIGVREPGKEAQIVDFLSALIYYGTDNERDLELLRFFIQEKGLRTHDWKVLRTLLIVDGVVKEEGKFVVPKSVRTLFLTSIDGLPAGERTFMLKQLINFILSEFIKDEKDIDFPSAYLDFLFTVEPDLISTEHLFIAISLYKYGMKGSKKVALLLSKISNANLRQTITFRGFTGTALDFAKGLRAENFKGIDFGSNPNAESELQSLLSIITMIEGKFK